MASALSLSRSIREAVSIQQDVTRVVIENPRTYAFTVIAEVRVLTPGIPYDQQDDRTFTVMVNVLKERGGKFWKHGPCLVSTGDDCFDLASIKEASDRIGMAVMCSTMIANQEVLNG